MVSLSHAELIELYEIVSPWKAWPVAAAERMSEAEIDELRRVLSTHERDEAFQAGVGYYQQEGDFDFHYRIIQGSGNRTLAAAVRRALPAGAHVPHPVLHHAESAASGLRRTPPNLDAIAERDGELAELLMRRHRRFQAQCRAPFQRCS